MKSSTVMAYIASVCITTAVAYTANMTWWCAALLSAGLMAALNNMME